ncbi:MAG TPA: EscN/YscN/HrcN family type III secretion system ATPase, partial [Clostridiaceae bacterium]|nr:EscN/YscN/HrcN family type III secretion system ATPase [Clostridiaceae bacterium]
DAVRGILDGHIILSRDLASRNHYPAIDILSSISRLMDVIVSKKQKDMAGDLRSILATYKNAEDLINIGAYAKGSNPGIDKSIKYIDKLMDFLKQDKDTYINFDDTMDAMKGIYK